MPKSLIHLWVERLIPKGHIYSPSDCLCSAQLQINDYLTMQRLVKYITRLHLGRYSLPNTRPHSDTHHTALVEISEDGSLD
jgi:hypothetical protein